MAISPNGGPGASLTARRRLPSLGPAALAALAILMLACDVGLVILPALAQRSSQTAEVIMETRLRSAPRRKGEPLVRLPPGSRLTIHGRPENGWYQASRGSIEGFVQSGAVAPAPLPPAENARSGEAIDEPGVVELEQRADRRDRPSKAERKAARKAERKRARKAQRRQERQQRNRGDQRNDAAVVTSTDLNLRAAPAQDAPVLATIPRRERIEPTGEHEEGWLEIRWEGDTGWVLGRYLAAPRRSTRKRDRDSSSWSRAELKAIIFAAADRYGQPREDMLRVARCESNMTPSAVNEHGGSYGLFQFKPGTWLSTPFAEYDIFDPRASANAAAWMWSVGRRREWVCQ